MNDMRPLRSHDHSPAPTLQTIYRDGVALMGACCGHPWPITGGGWHCNTCGRDWPITVGEPRETAVEGVA